MASQEEIAQIRQMTDKAMERFDLLYYDEAINLLELNLAQGRALGLANEPVMGEVHLSMGIMLFLDENELPRARASFINAVTFAPDIQLPEEYVTPELQAFFTEATQQVSATGAAEST